MKVTERTHIRNHPERAVPEEAAEILSAGMVAHVGFVQDGQPFVIPFSYLYDASRPDRLYLHSSVTSRAMNHLAVHAGGAVCLAIALNGDEADLSSTIEVARAHLLRFIEWYDDAGGALEIGAYWGYGNEHTIRGLLALRENGWPKIFHQRARKLDRFLYPALTMCIGNQFIPNFTDAFRDV